MSNSKYRLEFRLLNHNLDLVQQFVLVICVCLACFNFQKECCFGYANLIYYFLIKTFSNHTSIIHFSRCSSQNISLGFQTPYGPQHLEWECKLGIQRVHSLIPTYFSLYIRERFLLGAKNQQISPINQGQVCLDFRGENSTFCLKIKNISTAYQVT